MSRDGRDRKGRAAQDSGANGSIAAWCSSLWKRSIEPVQPDEHVQDVAPVSGDEGDGVHAESGHLPAREEVLYTQFWMVVQRLRRLAADAREVDPVSQVDVVSSIVLSQMGITQKAQYGEPYFRGWFQPATGPAGFISYMVKWLPRAENEIFRKCAYVEIPSMNAGIVPEGSVIPHGDERVTGVCSTEDMRQMLVVAMEKLKGVVESA